MSYEISMTPQTGWVCPLCGKVNAPWAPSCDCHIKSKPMTATYDENSSMTNTDMPEYVTSNTTNIICD
jgi:hypothetical protein